MESPLKASTIRTSKLWDPPSRSSLWRETRASPMHDLDVGRRVREVVEVVLGDLHDVGIELVEPKGVALPAVGSHRPHAQTDRTDAQPGGSLRLLRRAPGMLGERKTDARGRDIVRGRAHPQRGEDVLLPMTDPTVVEGVGVRAGARVASSPRHPRPVASATPVRNEVRSFRPGARWPSRRDEAPSSRRRCAAPPARRKSRPGLLRPRCRGRSWSDCAQPAVGERARRRGRGNT